MTISTSLVIADNAYGTLGSALATGDTTLTFTAGHGARFPPVASGQMLSCCILNSNNVLEEVQITFHTSGADTATMVRGANGTTAKAWNAGDRIEARISSDVLKRLQVEALKEITLSTGDGGATYTGSISPTGYGLVTGLIYALNAATTNSGTAPTINLSSLGAVTVKLDGGLALVSGQMPIHGLYEYDGTNLILLNPLGNEIATQAQMEAGTSLVTTVTPGRQQFHPSAAKVWAFITYSAGTPTLAASYGVSGITDTGTGQVTITFATAFSSANYCAQVTAVNSGSNNGPSNTYSNLATGSVILNHYEGGSLTDPASITCVIYGDQ